MKLSVTYPENRAASGRTKYTYYKLYFSNVSLGEVKRGAVSLFMSKIFANRRVL